MTFIDSYFTFVQLTVALIFGVMIGISIALLKIHNSKKKIQENIDQLKEIITQQREHLILLEDKADRYEEILIENSQLTSQLATERTHQAELTITLTQERKSFQEKLILLEQARHELSQSFQALCAQALERNNRSFLDLATATLSKFQESAKGDLNLKEKAISDLINPLKESLKSVDQKIIDLEKSRESAYEVLRHQVGDLIDTQKELRLETANLVKALRAPHVRGRWGEMQLKRVVEMSGMSPHCDFVEQETLRADQENSESLQSKLRPDMIVKLPGQKRLIIDAKTPLIAYLDALDAKDDKTRLSFLKDHARHVRTHILALSSRAYWDQFIKQGESPEFVIMFLPGETMFSAALEHDPTLIELGVERKVILATPATLIALLHAVAYGWRQERLTENAYQISQLGRELYKRLSDMGGHLSKLGQSLGMSVRTYNSAIASLESRVLPSARKFKDLEASSSLADLPDLPQLDHIPRNLQSLELQASQA